MTWIGYIGGIMFLFSGFILIPILSFVTTRYFNNKLGFKKFNNPLGKDWLMPGFAGGQYATLIVFRRGAKRSYDRYVFGEIDFRKKARLIDKLLYFAFVILGYGGMLLMVIDIIYMLITEYLLK
jgi:hypothetical protein